jgi:hypothetical protein
LARKLQNKKVFTINMREVREEDTCVTREISYAKWKKWQYFIIIGIDSYKSHGACVCFFFEVGTKCSKYYYFLLRACNIF